MIGALSVKELKPKPKDWSYEKTFEEIKLGSHVTFLTPYSSIKVMVLDPIYELKSESWCLMKCLTSHTETKIGLGSQNKLVWSMKSFETWVWK